jgi:hypothetical protein
MEIIYNKDYRVLMKKQIREQLLFLLKNDYEFMMVVNRDGVEFNPTLPEKITSQFRDFISFAIAGYSFSSAFVNDNQFVFEAGFGEENIGAMVYIDIDRILQIVIQENPIFINVLATTSKIEPKDSMEVFKSKARNKKFFSKNKG